jgi:hypothetical protein
MNSLLHLELATAIASERQRQAATLRSSLVSTRGARIGRRALRARRAANAATRERPLANAPREDASQRLIA